MGDSSQSLSRSRSLFCSCVKFPWEEAKMVWVIQGTGVQRTHNLGNSGIVNFRTAGITHASLYTHMGIGPGCHHRESQSPRSRWRARD